VSPIGTAFILGVLALSFWLTLRKSVGAAFVYAMLPSLLIAYTVTPINVQKLPDVGTVPAASYGIMLALMVRGWRRTFGLGVIDWLVLAMFAWRIVAVCVSAKIWTGVSTLGSDTLNILIPYFAARATFVDREWRLKACVVCCVAAMFLAAVALVEMRLTPQFFSRQVLRPLGLTSASWEMTLKRFGLFRAQASFVHPIDLGNGAAILGSMILALGLTSGKRIWTWWRVGGFLGTVVMAGASLSFTSYVAGLAIVVIFSLLLAHRSLAVLLIPIGLATLMFYVDLTRQWTSTQPEAPVFLPYESADETSGSVYIRHLIVHRTWPMASEAGVFGYSQDGFDPVRSFDLLSIDNAYVLFVLEYGWGYLVLMLLLGFVVAGAATRALLRLPGGPDRAPLAAGTAGVIGTFLGMYTVFFGFVYGVLFWILIGIVQSMIREVYERTGEAEPVQLQANREAEAERRGAGAFA